MACKCKKQSAAYRAASVPLSNNNQTVVVQFLEKTTVIFDSGVEETFHPGDVKVMSYSVYEAVEQSFPDSIRRRA